MTYTLHHGDCLDILPTLGAQSVDAIIADPPYGTTACKWDSVIPFEPMWAQLKRIIKPRGAIVLFGSQPFTSALVMSWPQGFKYEWVWRKNYASGFQNARKQPMRNHESVLIFGEDTPIYNPVKQRSKSEQAIENARRGQMVRRKNSHQNRHGFGTKAFDGVFQEFVFPTTVQDFDCVTRYELVHETQKPLALLEYLVKTYTHAGDTVLDFTMGSGTTGEACINTGRDFIGIEMDKGYYDIAAKRLDAAAARLVQMELAV